jgi:hypothetical protein
MSPLARFAEAACAPTNNRGDLAGVTYSIAGFGNEREGALMASFDYDVVIIGSGFGGSVAALRTAEKG